jgi:uncharacterized Fe-S radical SAM superfamily protein PflX
MINVMEQYRPAYRAAQFPGLRGGIDFAEVNELRRYAASRALALAG